MKIFLDTSSLFKLYHREADTFLLEQLFSAVTITNVFLSEISKIEFTSTVWKKVRT
jgi:predicted nucleic acid-binding protein